jgi:hypothetical protein
MKRLVVIVACLLVLIAGIAPADEVANERTILVVETTWIDLHDTSLLPEPVVSNDMTAPRTMMLTDLSEEEVAALTEAGTVISEPAVILPNGRSGSAGHYLDSDDDRRPEAEAGVKCFAKVLPDGGFVLQVDFWSYDKRPEAPEAETSLRTMLRVAEGETVLLARVGEDGEILNPVYLLTARVVED